MYKSILNRQVFAKTKDFFIGIDSDGCVFDSMDIKQKYCFCPQFIKHMGLESISDYACEAWDFVNLHSRARGANRFLALIKVLDLLGERVHSLNVNHKIPELSKLKEWIKHENKLSNETLKAEIDRNWNNELSVVLEWSLDIDNEVERKAFSVPIFQMVSECLEKMNDFADVAVISQTPSEVIKRDWKEHNIIKYTKLIVGQEDGIKTEQLMMITKDNYAAQKCMMIGDAWGDLEAACEAGILFYPIIPGFEVQSWKRFYDEALDKFLSGQYTVKYQELLITEFESILPSKPHWEKKN